jgi:hypothetical protein
MTELRSTSSHLAIGFALALALALAACGGETAETAALTGDAADAQAAPAPGVALVALGPDDIGGVVTGPSGPEAGVWVIAETEDFDTMFAKIVVTDDAGRYVVPDLPEADYQIWVRGYGLSDSEPEAAARGAHHDIAVEAAASPAADAQNYPAAYWYAMMHLPTEEEVANVPGGLNGYLTWVKNMGCVGCHQMGNAATRMLPPGLGEFESTEAAWARRIQSGQAGQNMAQTLGGLLGGVPIGYLADWTDRIAAGELPHAAPERPSGRERNVVATVRDWSDARAYIHDLSGTDRRDPTVNAYGPLYGAPELSTDEFPILDPATNAATTFTAPVRDADTPGQDAVAPLAPSPYWGDERIWDSNANAHNPMLDEDGRVWYTAVVRSPANPPAFCGEGSDHPSAQLFPNTQSGRQLSLYDPESGDYTFIDTCYGTHHLQFAEDDDDTLWTSGGGQVVGWLNTRLFLETGDAAAAQGWSPLILDVNANGVRDEWTEPGAPIDPTKDARVPAAFYAVMPNPADGSVWGSNAFGYPGAIVRYDPETGLGERYTPPLPGFGVRGADIDRNGVVWASLGSGHLGAFDRSKCRGPLNGPEATGAHCPEGWTLYELPGPGFVDLPEFSVESSYYTWVDQHDTLGLGADTPIATGNLFDGVHALVDGEFVTLRIPYPLGFYTKGFEGRIDDPDAGWKGRGLWAPSGDRTPFHREGGLGSLPLVVHFQLRPDPLAN